MTARSPAWALALSGALALLPAQAPAHPHVFVDGGVDLVFSPARQLTALNVTWLYDEFETLYMLAAHDISPNALGGLNEADRQDLIRRLGDWPDDFDGSVHLSVDGAEAALAWPEGLDAQMVDGRLRLTFTRTLERPLDLGNRPVEIAFFEATYFFDFTLTNTPKLRGPAEGCAARVIPFDPDAQDNALLDMLAKLSREDIPEDERVGAFFADRIVVQCE